MAWILVVDDDREIRELIVFTLRFAGHAVVSATNGEEGCILAKQNKPDLILMDVSMPKMNGYEACKALKADKETASIPVIFLLVRGQEAEDLAGLNTGGEDYFLMPISPDRLTEKINLFLKKAGK
ncbi:MAG: response regulator [Anaerolineales bacterium]